MFSVAIATDRDHDEVWAIERDGEEMPDGSELPGRAAVIASALADSRCLVAIEDETVVGFAIHDRSLFGRPFLALLRVRAASRRRGIGTTLVQAVMATTEGDRLFGSTKASNHPMRMLLGRLGFTASGFIENLDPGDPEMIYIRWLGAAAPSPLLAPAEAPD